MPEGDTLARTAAVLGAVLAGREIQAARGRAGAARLDLLAGHAVEGVEARGKHLLILVSGGLTLHTHLGMHGAWHRYHPGERWQGRPDQAVAVLETADAVAVCFRAVVVEMLETRALPLHPVLSRLGPDLLGEAPDLDAAVARLREPGRAASAIGDALLDQRAQAGIGNVYRSEVCFLERVDPFAPVASLDDATLRRLLETARGLLVANAGTPFRLTRPSLLGEAPGPFTARPRGSDRLWVYGRAGRPCRRCGTLVASRVTPPLARRVYWCPRCQPASVRRSRGPEPER